MMNSMSDRWLSWPYGKPEASGFWELLGWQGSHMNFCEEDYLVTHYVAEFFNAITSLAYIGYGIHGINRNKRQHVSAFAAVNFPYWGLMSVGLASSIYHSTLKYHTQMADEMSMHLATGCVLLQVFNFRKPAHIQKRNSILIIGGLTSFIVYHCLTDEFVLHVVVFFGLSVTVSRMTSKINKETVKNPDHRKKLSMLTKTATATAIFAYLLWNIDVHFCNYVTDFKRWLGMPWGIVLELHGWWHILTAISSYTFMAMVEFLTCPEHDESHGVGFAWPAKGVLQDLVQSIPSPISPSKTKMNGKVSTNGSADSSANGSMNGSTHKKMR